MVYESMKQCATKTGTDYKLIKAAKGNKDAPGFNVGGSSAKETFGGNLSPLDGRGNELQSDCSYSDFETNTPAELG